MLIYKMDVLENLKKAGYNTTRLRKEKLLGENAIQYIRQEKPVGAKALDRICELLDCQPGDILEYKKVRIKCPDFLFGIQSLILSQPLLHPARKLSQV